MDFKNYELYWQNPTDLAVHNAWQKQQQQIENAVCFEHYRTTTLPTESSVKNCVILELSFIKHFPHFTCHHHILDMYHLQCEEMPYC